MDIASIIGIAFSLALAGLGAGAGLRLLQLRRESQRDREAIDGGATAQDAEDKRLRRRVSRPVGSRRTTGVHGGCN